MHVTIPDIFTFFRMICAVVLPFLTPLSPAFLIIYAVSGASDMADGYLARKLGQSSAWGAKLDSAADLLLYTIALSLLIPIMRAILPGWFWWLVGVALILRLACYFLSAVKFHRFASEHSLLNKLTSILIFPAPFFMRMDFFVWYAILVCLVSCCAAIQELGIHLRRPVTETEREEE
jgi:CDP-diacylglycerol--glycerol-3-phosphate 3-phosphatidyltransferase